VKGSFACADLVAGSAAGDLDKMGRGKER
jgi:hypothetical protein